MRSDRIRSTFFSFFDNLGHLKVPPGRLVTDDESLLFTIAGMVPLKSYFTGERPPPHRRLMSAQRCVRTVDIDNIGHTRRHATSFEMLGSFAFGDYFKRECMAWALELLTVGYGLQRSRLSVTVYEHDDESVDLWRDLGVPSSRIQRLGTKDNFWQLGDDGPAGPNTELFYDFRGEPLEIWNLVFINGRHIDTGLGLDRLAMVLQDTEHVQDIDEVRPLLERVSKHVEDPVSQRIVTDHLRTSLCLIGEGITPGNTGRGYVLRRLLRRAVYHAGRPILGALTSDPVIAREEKAFSRTLDQGERLLTKALQRQRFDASVAFKLYETHGFPVELTTEIVARHGIALDRAGFDALMDEHRRLSRRPAV